jgi:hypothetical protein
MSTIAQAIIFDKQGSEKMEASGAVRAGLTFRNEGPVEGAHRFLVVLSGNTNDDIHL